MRLARSLVVSSFCVVASLAGIACKKDDKAIKETPAPIAQESKKVEAGAKRFVVADQGMLKVWMETGEKFSGEANKLGGVFDVDFGDLTKSTGEVTADLDTFKSTTPDIDDETQTEHAKNWFEIGDDVPKDKRDDYKIARFTIEKITKVSSPTLKDVPEKDGARVIELDAHGQLRVHGRSSPKDVRVELSFVGPLDAPNEIRFRTLDPVAASLSEHDVKPRDVAGKFIAGALEKVGKKIDDRPLISVEGTAKPKS